MIAQRGGYLYIENILNVTAHRFEQSDVLAAGIQDFLDVVILEDAPKRLQVNRTHRIDDVNRFAIEYLNEERLESVTAFEAIVFRVEGESRGMFQLAERFMKQQVCINPAYGRRKMHKSDGKIRIEGN